MIDVFVEMKRLMSRLLLSYLSCQQLCFYFKGNTEYLQQRFAG